MVQSYQAASDFADEMVGRLLDQLDKTGRAENTIIVLWSDHGYHLGDKTSCGKTTLWEKANHVPFIIVAPGITKPGTRIDTPVGLVDIYPTLLDLAGLPAKPDLDGQSLVPLLKDPQAKWDRPALMTQGRGNHCRPLPRLALHPLQGWHRRTLRLQNRRSLEPHQPAGRRGQRTSIPP